MYAIIADGGRQFRVEEGQELTIDYREDLSTGDPLTFGEVLAVRGDAGLQIGRPNVAGASVSAEVIGVEQGPKLVIQWFSRRKNARRRTGHRQIHTKVRITKIGG
jgi:large subunit ribosomal protein L21